MPIIKSLMLKESYFAPFSEQRCFNWQGYPISDMLYPHYWAFLIFLNRLFFFPTIELVLSDEYVIKYSQLNLSLLMPLWTKLNVNWTSEPTLILVISNNEVLIKLSCPSCLTRTGRYLSVSSLLSLVTTLFHVDCSYLKSSSMLSFATTQVNSCVVLVLLYLHFTAYFGSGNIYLTSFQHDLQLLLKDYLLR